MKTLYSVVCLSTILGTLFSAPVERKNKDKLEDLKSKLASLQDLLQELGSHHDDHTTTTAIPTTAVANQPAKKQESPLDVTDQEVMDLLQHLSPDEISVLQKVKSKLDAARDKIISETIQSRESSKKQEESLIGWFGDGPAKEEEEGRIDLKTVMEKVRQHNQELPSQSGSKNETVEPESGFFGEMNKPGSNADKRTGNDVSIWHSAPIGHVWSVDSEGHSHSAYSKKEFLESVERRLLADVQFAKAHGISLTDLTKDYERKVGQTHSSSVERELGALHGVGKPR